MFSTLVASAFTSALQIMDGLIEKVMERIEAFFKNLLSNPSF